MDSKSFEEIALMWLEDKRQYVKKSTYCAYSLLVNNHLKTAFVGKGVVTEDMLQQFVFRKLEQGLSQKSVKDMLVVMKMILHYAQKHDYLPPCDMEVRFPTDARRRGLQVMSREHQRLLMEYVRNNGTYMNLGIYICMCAGLRIGEVCALVWDDIDLERGVISISKTLQRIYVIEGEERYTELLTGSPKSRSSVREVPLVKELAEMIKPMKGTVAGHHYVLTNSTRPLEPRAYRNYYNALIRRLNLPKLKFHGLRHTFATRCIESECDYKTVSVLMGHANINTTLNLYVHPDMEQKKRCVERMLDFMQ